MSSRRLSSIAVLIVLVVPVSLTGLAWACAPSNWGWTPPATPSATPVAPAPQSTRAPAPAPAPAPNAQPAAPVSEAAAQPAAPVTELIESPAPQKAPSRSTQPARSSARQPTPSTATQRPSSIVPRAHAVAASAAVQPNATRAAAPTANVTKSAAATEKVTKKDSRPKSAAAEPKPAASAAPADAKRWTPPASAHAADTADLASPTPGTDLRLLFGAGLLGLGLVAMLGAFTVLEARRRRASAGQLRDHGRG